MVANEIYVSCIVDMRWSMDEAAWQQKVHLKLACQAETDRLPFADSISDR